MDIGVHLNFRNLNLVNGLILQVNNSPSQLNLAWSNVCGFRIITDQTLIYLRCLLLMVYSVNVRRFGFHLVGVGTWWLIGLLRIKQVVVGRVTHLPLQVLYLMSNQVLRLERDSADVGNRWIYLIRQVSCACVLIYWVWSVDKALVHTFCFGSRSKSPVFDWGLLLLVPFLYLPHLVWGGGN